MAERFKDIRVSFTGDDTQLKQVTGRVRQQAANVGKDVKKMSVGTMLGFRSITNVAERLGQTIGLQTAYMTDLSQAFETQASKGIPRWVWMLGGGALAIGALAFAVKKLVDRKKEMRAEMIKSAKAADTLIGQLKGLASSTDNLTDAQERYRKAELAFRRFDLVGRIQDQKEAIKDLGRDLSKTMVAFELQTEKTMERTDRALAEYRAGQAKLQIFKEQLAIADEILASKVSLRQKREAEEDEKRRKKKLDGEKMLGDAMVAEWRRRQTEEERLNALRVGTARSAMQNIVGTFQMLATFGGKHQHKMFQRYKQFAKAQAGISAAEAAISAYKAMAGIPYVGPALGAAAATAALAYGYAQIRTIDRMQPGGSIGAVGVAPANPATGLPGVSTPAAAPNLTLIINGQTMEIGQITEDIVQELYNSGGSTGGGLRVEGVVRSA